MSISFNKIGLSQPAASTITMEVRTVTWNINSTNVHGEVLTLGDPESSAAVAKVSSATAAANDYGLVTRPILRSSAADFLATIYQSTASELKCTVEPGVNPIVVSANQGAASYIPVRLVDSSGTGFVALGTDYADAVTSSTHIGTAIAFNNSSGNTYRVAGSSTPLPTYTADSTGRGVGTSTSSTSAAAGAPGLNVRQVLGALQSTTVLCNITAGGSTALVSSAAGVQHKLFAYSVVSTIVAVSSVCFCSSANERWGLMLGSQSSGVTGANLAIPPPGYLMTTEVASALNFTASQTGLYRVSISYFTE